MVNITYGVLSNPDGNSVGSANIAPNGTDLIVTYDSDTKIASYNPGAISWVLTCTALVWIMIPGLGYLYSGLARRKNALHLLLLTLAALAVTGFQWFFWGYSLAFSQTSNAFIGNMRNFGFMNVLQDPVAAANNKIPEIVYAAYEGMFAALVPAIAIGAACERGRVWPFLVLVFCWNTLVFDFLAAWVWNPNGWAFKWGVLDYAGGGPIEIASGITGTVISYYLGPRRGYGTEKLLFKPHNVSHIVLGTAFLWFGWLGFNGGSTFDANIKAAMAIMTTNTAASVGGLAWMFMDFRLERKWSVVGFCTGAIAGLVAITAAAGFVGLPASVLIGVAAAVISNYATQLKSFARCDDVMDVFAVHALAGIVGLLLTGIFAQASVAANDGYTEIPGGWLDGHWIQLPKQIAWCAVCAGWTGLMTYILMFIIDHTPYVGPFRTSVEAEIIGVDEDQCGEFAYDYAFINRDLEGNCEPSQIPSHRDYNPALNMHEKAPGYNSNSPDPSRSEEDVGSSHSPEQIGNDAHVEPASNAREAAEKIEMEKVGEKA